MIRDITIGQYYQTDSLLHRLDPRTKLVGTVVFVVSVFLASWPFGYLLAAAYLVLMITLSHVPVSFMLRGLKAVMMLLIISMCFNLFLTRGETVLVKFWIFTVTLEGVKQAAAMAVRLVFLIMGSSLMTLTTTPNQLTDGLETGLRPLSRFRLGSFRVPVHEIAMMMSIALRFIPLILEETDKIMKAQMARGADFESGNLIERAKALVPILVPLFLSAIRRATDLANAMEARCYHGGENRTKMKPLRYETRDRLTYLVFVVYLALMAALRVAVG